MFARGNLLLIGVVLFVTSCSEPPLKWSDDWMPKAVGGPIEIRPLPPADQLREDYEQWIRETNAPRLRLYAETIEFPAVQTEFKFNISRGDTPVGQRTFTHASFVYSNHTKGLYELSWMEAGRQRKEFLLVKDRPRKFLLMLTQTRNSPFPELQIVAIEGVQNRGVRMASSPDRVP